MSTYLGDQGVGQLRQGREAEVGGLGGHPAPGGDQGLAQRHLPDGGIVNNTLQQTHIRHTILDVIVFTDLSGDGLVCPLVEPVSVEQQPVLVVHVGPDSGHVGAVPGAGLEAQDPGVGGHPGHQAGGGHQGVTVPVHKWGQRLSTPDLITSGLVSDQTSFMHCALTCMRFCPVYCSALS